MNHCYRAVFNAALDAWVAVSELQPARGKPSRSARARRAPAGRGAVVAGLTALAAALALGFAAPRAAQAQTAPAAALAAPAATALPQGAQVVAGQAAIATRGATMNITQGSDRAIVNWQQFDIGAQATVNIQQPSATSAMLNRVVGVDPSQIMGRLNANGQVVLINPNGVLFGAGARVDVGSLVASTLDTTDADFQAGKHQYRRGNAAGKVRNEGKVTAAAGGFVALLAADVHNAGIVTAQRGSVVLAAGEAVTLTFAGRGVQVQVDPANVAALVENSQLIEAAGGTVVMTARAANALLSAAVNNSGAIHATAIANDGGSVRLVAAVGDGAGATAAAATAAAATPTAAAAVTRAAGSSVTNSGSIVADGSAQGGSVKIDAAQVDLFGSVSARGATAAGGSITVDAQRTVSTQASKLDAGGATDGGSVRITSATAAGSNGGAYLSGAIAASGDSGRGGQVDITGRDLRLFGAQITATGATGGGSVRIGGDYQGKGSDIANAATVQVAASTAIDASATADGRGGRVIVWADDSTTFLGSIRAQGAAGGVAYTKGSGSFVEVSGLDTLNFGGQVQADTLLLDPKTIHIVDPGVGISTNAIVDPDSASTGFGITVSDLANGNLLILSPNQNQIGSGGGYVFQRDGTLVWAMRDTGAVANWRNLGGDRWLVTSGGAQAGLGAISVFNLASPGASGRLNSANALMGNRTYGDGFGSTVLDLTGGYWAVGVSVTGERADAYALKRGAWHFFKADASSTNIATGTLSSSNSLVGASAGQVGFTDRVQPWQAAYRGDSIGYLTEGALNYSQNNPVPVLVSGFKPMSNGTWVMASSQFSDTSNPAGGYNHGAVTIISPALIDSGALRGVLSSSNSIVGTSADQRLGFNIRQVDNGVVGRGLIQVNSSTEWILNLPTYGGTGALVGLTPARQSAGVTGTLTAGNALLMGGTPPKDITFLSNGALVFTNPEWNDGRGYFRGQAASGQNIDLTLRGSLAPADYTTAVVGGNGGTQFGAAQSQAGTSVIDLGGGRALVYSGNTSGTGSSISQGAFTVYDTNARITGVLGAGNSVMGSTALLLSPTFNDGNGPYDGVKVLSNGSFVLKAGRQSGSVMANNSSALVYGAATGSVTGTLDLTSGPAFALVLPANQYSYGELRQADITDLGGGRWVAQSYSMGMIWGGPNLVRTGRTDDPSSNSHTSKWFQGVAAIAGLPTQASPGRLLVAAPGALGGAGAVFLMDVDSAAVPAPSTSNALVGTITDAASPSGTGDRVGGGLYAIGNGSYLVSSADWNEARGAVTLLTPANMTTRLAGTISAANSLVGSTPGDLVGRHEPSYLPSFSSPGEAVGSTGWMAVKSPFWNDATGAVTFFRPGIDDLTATVSSSNSLVGHAAGDGVGLGLRYSSFADPWTFKDLGGGQWVMRTGHWDPLAAGAGPGQADWFNPRGGALTWLNFTAGSNATRPTGTVDASNSLVAADNADGIGREQFFTDSWSMLMNMGGGYWGLTTPGWNGNRGAFTLFQRGSAPVGNINSTNSLTNGQPSVVINGTTTPSLGPQTSSLQTFGSGWAMLTPTWGGGAGAITYFTTAGGVHGDIGPSISLVGADSSQALGSSLTLVSGGNIVIGSKDWGDGRGAATWRDTTVGGGLAATLRGTITVSAANSFVGSVADDPNTFAPGDHVASGGVTALSNDLFTVSSPDFHGGLSGVNGATTLGQGRTNSMVGAVGVNNSFLGFLGGATVTYISPEGATGVIFSTGNEVGYGEITQPVALQNGQMNFATYGSSNVNIRPSTITAVLNTGTSLTLQATDSIRVSAAVVSNNPSGAGGNLTLQTQTGDIIINPLGRIVTDDGNLVVAAGRDFRNYRGADAFNTGAGSWTVYSRNPALDYRNGLAFDYKQYGTTYAGVQGGSQTLLGSGNGFVYSLANPMLSGIIGGYTRQYDATTRVANAASFFAPNGLIDGDEIATLATLAAHAGTQDVSVTYGSVTSSTATGNKPVYGYLGAPAAGQPVNFSGAAVVTPRLLNPLVSASGPTTKVYDGSTATPTGFAATAALGGAVSGDTLTLGNYTVAYSSADAGASNPIEVRGSGLAFTANGNASVLGDYALVTGNNFYQQIAASITKKPVTLTGTVATSRNYNAQTSVAVTNPGTLVGVLAGDAARVNLNGTATGYLLANPASNVTADIRAAAAAGSGKSLWVGGMYLTGGASGNYALNFTAAPTTTTVNIAQAPVTLAGVTGVGRAYDGTTVATLDFTNATVSGVFAGDNVGAGGSSGYTANFDTRHTGSGKTITYSGGTLGGGQGANYTLAANQTTTGSITPRTLTFGASFLGTPTFNNTIYQPAGNLADLTNVASIDVGNLTVSGGQYSLVFGNKNAGTTPQQVSNNTGGLGLSLSGSALGPNGNNYVLPSPLGSTTIAKAPLQVALNGATVGNKTYDGSTAGVITNSGSIGFSGQVSGDSSTLTLSSPSATFASANVNNGISVSVTGTLGGTGAGNYYFVPATTSANITPAGLTVTGFSAPGKVYDGTTAATITSYTWSGIRGSDASLLTLTPGSLVFSSADAGSRTVTASGGWTLGGSATTLANYTWTAPGTLTASNVTISPKPVQLTSVVASKAYDGTTTATISGTPSVVGVLAGDSANVNVASSSPTAVFASANAGNNVTVTISGYSLTGSRASNYSLQTSAFGNITQRLITLNSFTTNNKAYDGLLTADFLNPVLGNATVSGQGLTVTGSAAFATKNVANGIVVTASGLALAVPNGSSANLANYQLTTTSLTNSANITQRVLTLTGLAAADKTYNASNAATLTNGGTLSNTLSGEALTFTAGAATFSDANYGVGKTVTLPNVQLALPSGSTASLANYSLASSFTTTASIAKRTLTLAGPSINSRVYDATTTATTVSGYGTLSGLQGSDNLGVTASGVDFTTADVGNFKDVTLTGVALTGGTQTLRDNYQLASTLTYSSLASVTRRTISITSLSVADKTYDATRAATIGNVVLGNVPTGVTLGLTGLAEFFDPNASGSAKPVTVGSLALTGGTNPGLNYRLASTSWSNASALINPAPLTLNFSVVSKQYDGNSTATLSGAATWLGLLGTDRLNASVTSLDFGGTDAGYYGSVTANGVSASVPAGSGTLLSNYAVPTSATGSGQILQRQLTLSGLTIANKVYDGTYGATITSTGTLAGVQNGEQVGVDVSAATANFSNTANVSTNQTVDVFGLQLQDLSSGQTVNLSNYSISSVQSSASITRRQVTVSGITASNKTYDGSASASVNVGGAVVNNLVSGEALNFSAGSGATFASANASASAQTVTLTGGALVAGNVSTLVSNYQLVPVTTTALITPKTLTVSGLAAQNKVYDATTAATLSGGTLTGLVGSDTLTLVAGSAAFSGVDFGNGLTVNVSGLALAVPTGSSALASNYTLASTTATLSANITKRQLTAAGLVADKAYDAGTTASFVNGATLTGLVASDVSGGRAVFSASNATAAFTGANAGASAQTVNLSGLSLTGAGASNYLLPTTTTALITPRQITVLGISASNKAYDGSSLATLTGSTLGNTLSGQTLTLSASSATFAGVNASGSAQTVTAAGLSLVAGSGAVLSNYSLVGSSATTTALITPRALSVSGTTAAGKTYDRSTTASVTLGTVSGYVGSETLSITASGVFDSMDAGSRFVTASYALANGSNGGLAANYSLAATTSIATTIAQKQVTVAYTAAGKVYDRTDTATVTASTTDLFSADNVTISQTAVFANRNVTGSPGTVNISAIALNGARAVNYSLVSTTATAQATITPKALSISGMTAQNKVYDATTTATISGSPVLAGVISGDTVSVSGTAAGAFADKNVAPGKSIVVSGLTLAGAQAGNYSIGALSATADITAAPLAVQGATAADKTYDGNATATVSGGFVTALGNDVLTLSAANASFPNKNAGAGRTVTTAYVLSGTDAANYALSQPSNLTATIFKRTVGAIYTATGRVYDGGTGISVTPALSGVLTPDLGALGITQTAALASANANPAQLVNLTGMTLTGAEQGNYQLSATSTTTTAAITPKALTVSGTTATGRAYDGSTTATFTVGTLSGFVGSETVTATAAGNFDSADAGSRTASAVYTLVNGTNGGLAANYSLAGTSGLSATITQKLLTIGGFAVAAKTYDTTTAATVTNWGSVATGVGSQTLVLNHGSAAFASANANNSVTVTASGYSLADGSAGGLAANYQLTSSSAATSAAINRAPLTMTALNAGKAFSDTDPTFSASFTGFVGGQTSSVLTGVGVTRPAGESAGSYVLTPTATAANYSITPVTGTFTISPADQLVLQLGNVSTTYGTATPGYTVTSAKYYSSQGAQLRSLTVTPGANNSFTVDDGLGTSASFTLGSGSAPTSGSGFTVVGNHAISGSGFTLLSGSNFSSHVFAGGNLAITARAVTVSGATTTRRDYDGTTTAALASAGTLQNAVGGDAVSLDTSAIQGGYADRHAGSGKTATYTGAALQGADAGNYSFGGSFAASGIVDARALVWTGITVANKTYDNSTAATVTGNGGFTNVAAVDQGAGSLTLNSVTAAFASKDVQGAQQAVNVTATLGGTAASDYTLGAGSTQATIAPLALNVAGAQAQNRVYDGTANATVTGGGVTALGSDQVVLSAANASFADRHAAPAKTVTTGYTLSGAQAGNYTVVQPVNLSATIAPKTLTIGGLTVAGKTYDAGTTATIASAGSLQGLVGGDALSFSTGAAQFASANAAPSVQATVGNVALVVPNGSLALASDYSLATSFVTNATISPRQLTIAGMQVASRDYDGTTAATLSNAGNLVGVQGSDSLGFSIGSIAFATADAGPNKQVTIGGVQLTANGGTLLANYLAPVAGSSSATINPRPITAGSASVAGKTYDATTAATLSGWLLGNTVTGEALGLSGTATFASANAGTQNATIGNLSLVLPTGSTANLANYVLVTNSLNASAVIAQRALTVSGSSVADKLYDASTAATITSAGSLVGLQGSDVLGLSAGSASFASVNAGSPQTVTLTNLGLTGNSALFGNYLLPASTTAQAQITPRPLSIGGVQVANRVYDGTTVATLASAGSLLGLQGNDAFTFGFGSATFASANASATPQAVTLAGLTLTPGSGTLASNYLAPAIPAAQATISPRPIGVASATVAGKTYDATTAATLTGATLTNLLTGQALQLGGTAAFASANAGTQAATVGNLVLLLPQGSAANLANYVLVPATVQTSGVIAPAQLSLSGTTVANKVYDGSTAASVANAGTLLGLQGNDVLTASFAGASFAGADASASPQAVTLAGLTLAPGGNTLASNYLAPAIPAAQATISPRPIGVAAATVAGKTYDATTAATLDSATLTNLLAGQALQLGGSAAYNSANAGAQTATVGNLVLLLAPGSAANLGNYVLVPATVQATGTIAPRALTVAGSSVADKLYDATTAATVTSAGSLVGLQGSDVLGLTAGSASFASANAGAPQTVTLANLGLTGNSALFGNYLLPGSTTAQAQITPRPLAIGGVQVANRVYDGTTAATLANTGSLLGLQGNDAFAFGFGSATFANANASANPQAVTLAGLTLTPGAGTLLSNYLAPAIPAAQATILPRPINVASATVAGKTYDATTGATLAGATLTNLLPGQALQLGGSAAFGSANSGTQTATVGNLVLLLPQGSAANLANYVLVPATVQTTATIAPAQLSISGTTVANATYNGSTAATLTNPGTLVGLKGADALRFSVGSANFASANAGSGLQTVTLGGLTLAGAAASNYTLPATLGVQTPVSIAPILLGTAGMVADRAYDATTVGSFSGIGPSGFLAIDLPNVSLQRAGATATFADADAGVNKPVTFNGLSLGGSAAGNYLLPGGTTASITPALLTLTGSSVASRAYNGSSAATLASIGTLQGVVPGTSVALQPGYSAAFNGAGAGSSTVTISGLTLNNPNYAISPTLQFSSQGATITPAVLTLGGLSVANKVVDGTTTAVLQGNGAASLQGRIGSDQVTLDTSGAVAQFAQATPGLGVAASVSGLKLSGADAANYVLGPLPAMSADITDSATGTLLSQLGTGLTTAGSPYATNGTAGGATAARASNGVLVASAAGGLPVTDGGGLMTDRFASVQVPAAVLPAAVLPLAAAPFGTAGQPVAAAPGGAGVLVLQAQPAGAALDAAAQGALPFAAAPAGATGLAANGGVANANPAGGFISVKPLGLVSVPAGGAAVVELPPDTFTHRTQDGGFNYEARQANGDPLPKWASFDAASGNLSLNPPAGLQETLQVVVIARDGNGGLAYTKLALQVGG